MAKQQGFTLIELMIVVAIIAILAAIAISQYQDYLIRTQISEGASLADGIKTAVGEFANNRGRFATGTNVSYGLASAASIAGTYVASVSVSGGVIYARYSSQNGHRASEVIDGQSLLFSPITHAGSIEWKCNKSSQLKEKWVPTTCRD
jgi:type IV pilus assembly protein PilA